MIHYIPKENEKGTSFGEDCWDEHFANKTETVFAQCNGYMGVRAALPVAAMEECRGTFLTGLYHKASQYEVSELINCPDVTAMQITVDDEKIYTDRCRMEDFSRELFLKTGELEVKMNLVTFGGKSLNIQVRRFASRKNRHLFVQEICVTPKQNCTICISEGINGQMTNSGAAHFARTEARVFSKNISVRKIFATTDRCCTSSQEVPVKKQVKPVTSI